ncbi:MAG: 30S ribosome-binding factor RbfA [Candidatus Omnitrophota bacterium]|nr:MAG: 30S ribosome-binding factor RbfA [Candidatus Omnitrophota bacterium]
MSRQDRVEKAIQKEVSSIIHDELKDPRLGFVTITRVEITKDLRDTKIFYSVLGQDKEHKDTKVALDSASGFIRKLIGERINLRFVPTIMFKEDRSSEYSVRIQKVLDEIYEKENIKTSSRKHKKK